MIRPVFAAMLVAALASTRIAHAQSTCPEGRPLTGDLGIERYLCVGGSCAIWVEKAGGLTHFFTTEPRIDRIDPDGPTGGMLERGDVLVAIDDLLITSAAAGRHLANLDPGVPVDLWIRRKGRDLRLRAIPVPGCEPGGLSVRIPGRR